MGLLFGKSRRHNNVNKNSKQFELQKPQLQNEKEFIYAKLIRGLSFYAFINVEQLTIRAKFLNDKAAKKAI